MDDDPFSQGYLDGWRSVRGEKEQPAIPRVPAGTGKSMYLIGFHRGVRDAKAVSTL
jgi:hypothetical protein